MKAVKIILAVLAAVAALFVIAAVLVASLFDPNDYKGVVADAFTARTGRTLTVERGLELSFFPWLAVQTGGITVGNAPGFDAATPFATIERVAARVKLLPLLSRQLEIGTVELDGLQLNLARDKDLRGNWQDLLDARSSPPDGAAIGPADSGGVSVESFALEGVRVRGGTVLWRENTSELRYTVSELDLSTGPIGPIGANDPIAIDVALKVKDELTGLTAAVSAAATTAIDGERLGDRARRRDESHRAIPAAASPHARSRRRRRASRSTATRKRCASQSSPPRPPACTPRGRSRAARCSTTRPSRAP